jgi:hypothetical protein
MESEKNPENEIAIEQLGNIHSIPDSAKSNILLVFMGLKPACKLSILFKEGTKAYPREDFEKDKSDLENVLQNLGLNYEFSEEETTDEGLQEVYISVGHSEDKLKTLTEAWQLPAGSEERDVEVGRALGIPETAIQSYANHETINLTELPPEIAQEFRRAEFIPSREHWEEELEEVRKRNQIVKGIAPKLFEK